MKKLLLLFFVAQLFFADKSIAQTVSLRKICNAGFLHEGRSVQRNGYLYTLDYYNTLHKTNLATGEDVKLGKDLFTNQTFFFGVGTRLFLIENTGAMKQIDTETGAWRVIFPSGSWRFLSRVIPVGNDFYTVSDGTLYHHPNMSPTNFKKLGGDDFTNVSMLLLTDSTVHTIIGSALYQINMKNGDWKKIAQDKAFRNFMTGAVLRDKLYTVESPGNLFVTNLVDGKRKMIDDKLFVRPKAVMMFPDSGHIYYVNNDYELFEVIITEGP